MSENLMFLKNLGTNKDNGQTDYSKEISHTYANTIVSRVENSDKAIVLEINPGVAQEDKERILGFNFDANDVLDVLKNGADGIYLAIGEHEAGELGSEKDGYTLVLFGTKEGNIMTENKVYNYSKPCPRNCPRESEII